MTYSSADPCFSVAGSGRAIRNYIGIFGSYLSDALLRLTGIASYFLPLFLFLYAVLFALDRKVDHPLLKKIGGTILFVSTTAVLSLQGDTIRLFGETVPSGGMLGSLLAYLLLMGVSSAGAYIITLTAIVIALLLLNRVIAAQTRAHKREVLGGDEPLATA